MSECGSGRRNAFFNGCGESPSPPSAFACECGCSKLQARQGELAERAGVRGYGACMDCRSGCYSFLKRRNSLFGIYQHMRASIAASVAALFKSMFCPRSVVTTEGSEAFCKMVTLYSLLRSK